VADPKALAVLRWCVIGLQGLLLIPLAVAAMLLLFIGLGMAHQALLGHSPAASVGMAALFCSAGAFLGWCAGRGTVSTWRMATAEPPVQISGLRLGALALSGIAAAIAFVTLAGLVAGGLLYGP